MPNPAVVYAKDILRWMYWGPVRAIVRLAPRGLSYRLIVLPAAIAMTLMPGRSARIARWISRVKGAPSTRWDVLDTYVQYYRNSLDTLLYSKLGPSNIDRFIKYEGLENLDKALSQGRGAILLHPHFGNEECLMPAMGHKGYRVSQIASRWEPHYLKGAIYALSNRIRRRAWLMRIGTRESLPVGFVYIDEGVRDIYRLLARNEVLLLAMDGREGASWLSVGFLGMQARISPGPMKIARSTGAPVLPVVIIRTGLYAHTVHIMKPIDQPAGGSDFIESGTRAALAAVEPHIRRHPSQYAKFLLLDVELFEGPEVVTDR